MGVEESFIKKMQLTGDLSIFEQFRVVFNAFLNSYDLSLNHILLTNMKICFSITFQKIFLLNF